MNALGEFDATTAIIKDMRRLLLLPLILPALSGCRSAPGPDSTKTYQVRGTVVSTDQKLGKILLQQTAVPGYMDAMTMSYALRQPGTISELHAGDRIQAKIQVDSNGAAPALDEVVITAQMRPDSLPETQYHVPATGDAVPDFAFVNQSGRRIHLAQFRGKVVALTFIYTRCPLADFCPRMSHNFFLVNEELRREPQLFAMTHLLSLSFDPAYDTPQVLRSYGGAVTGKFTREDFAHWDFAAPMPASELGPVSQFFDLGVQPGDNGTLNHSLSTLVLGKDGRVAAFYPTNEWKPEDLFNVMRTAAAK